MNHNRPEAQAVVDEILRFNRDRKPELLAIKYARMDVGAFDFFRGTLHLFAGAWTDLKPADEGPLVLQCGDLHVDNLGAYRADDGTYAFDVNDFDESLTGPAEFDVVRCAASVLLAAEAWGLPPAEGKQLAEHYLEQYAAAIAAAQQSGTIGEFTLTSSRGPIHDLLDTMALGTEVDLLDRHTRLTRRGRREIVRSADKHPDLRPARAARVKAAVEAYGAGREQPEWFHVVDVAGRIAGIGSLGLRRYSVLVEGTGSPDGNQLLDVKEERLSSAAVAMKIPTPEPRVSSAQRVVDAQRRLQGRPTAGLGVLPIGDVWYRVRLLIPEENHSRLERLSEKPAGLPAALAVVGQLTAWSQLRGARLTGVEAGLAKWSAAGVTEPLLAAATRFADLAHRQYDAFHEARRAGKFGSSGNS